VTSSFIVLLPIMTLNALLRAPCCCRLLIADLFVKMCFLHLLKATSGTDADIASTGVAPCCHRQLMVAFLNIADSLATSTAIIGLSTAG